MATAPLAARATSAACSTGGRPQAGWQHVRRPFAVPQRHQEQRYAAPEAAAAGRQRQRRHPVAAAAAADDLGLLGSASGAEEEWVEVGRIGPPHGVRGEMKVQPLTEFPEDRLGTPGPRWLQAPAPKIGRHAAAAPEEVELEWGRSMISKGNEVWLVKLEGVESPEEAALLRGHTLLIAASAREPLDDEDEFYVQDLVGLRVFLQATGEEVGHVADVFDGTGTHDVLRIELSAAQLARLAGSSSAAAGDETGEEATNSGSDGAAEGEAPPAAGPRHVLLPFAKAMVPVVDVAGGRMEVTPPEGLLELAAPSQMKRPRGENRGRRERRRPRPRGQAGAGAASGGDGDSAAGSDANSE